MSQENGGNEAVQVRADVPGLLGKAFNLFMEQPGVYIGAGLIVWFGGVVAGAGCVIANMIPIIGVLLNIVIAAVFVAFCGLMSVGLVKMARASMRGERPVFEDLFFAFGPPLVPTVIAFALIGLFSFIGAFCIIPAIVVQFLYMTTSIFLLDGERDFWAAMEKSRKLVLADVPQWLLAFVLIFAINLVGGIICGIGTIATVPISVILLALVYDQSQPASPAASVMDPPFD